MKSLTQIANECLTDKGSVCAHKNKSSNYYTDVYSAYMERLRDKPVRLLEIGLGVSGDALQSNLVTSENPGGASLRTWHQYFPNAQIFGIDINAAKFLDNDRIKTFVADQGDASQLQEIIRSIGPEQLDIIIDDGSHRPDHQQISFATLFPFLRPGGLYFIEDLSSNGFGDRLRGASADGSTINTRKLLREFKATSNWLSPNKLDNADELGAHFDFIAFHAIRPTFRLAPTLSLRRPLRKVAVYPEGRERVVVIGKKSQMS
jgi:hypothetical protein